VHCLFVHMIVGSFFTSCVLPIQFMLSIGDLSCLLVGRRPVGNINSYF
jgi:hypothetical protein